MDTAGVMKSVKAKSFVIRTWLEPGGAAAWRGVVTELETRRSKGFSRFTDLVRHLETEAGAAGLAEADERPKS